MDYTVIVYHGPGCPDGVTAAVIAKLRFPLAKLVYLAAGGTFPVGDYRGERIVFVDVCPPLEALVALAANNERVRVLDHHATSAKDLEALGAGNEVLDALFDMNRSGAMIAFNEFFPGEKPPRFVEYIQDHDLWRFDLPHSRALRSAFQMLEFRELAGIAALIESFDEQFDDLVRRGTELTAYLEKTLFPQIARNAYIAKYGKLDVVVCANNAYSLNSEFGHFLIRKYPGAAFVVIWNEKPNKWRLCSLRSTEYDVGAFAKKYNGGGHRTASGISITRATFDEIFKV